MSEKGKKERVYDERISPLMKQVIEICKGHGIAMIASFSIGSEDDPGLQVTTNLPDESGNAPERHNHAASIIRRGSCGVPPMQITVEKSDGSKELHAFIG